MSLSNTTSSERLHIAFFGCRNAGKSSLVNAVTNQQLSVVSDVKGTTTDPVKKAMELLPIGPVVIIDTAGLDDGGKLGELRIEKTMQVLGKTDIAVLVIDSTIGMNDYDKELIKQFEERKIPFVIVYNKSDLINKSSPPLEGGVNEPLTNKQNYPPLEGGVNKPLTNKQNYLPLEGGSKSLISGWGKNALHKYSKSSQHNAIELRNNPTKQERTLWKYLNKSQLGYKFRRQQPIGNYVADFFCSELNLIIELDGGQHNEIQNIEYDKKRTEFLNNNGYRVLRIWNNDIDNNIEGVIEYIKMNLTPPPSPLPHKGQFDGAVTSDMSKIVADKSGLTPPPNPLPHGAGGLAVSSKTGEGVNELRELLGKIASENKVEKYIIKDRLKAGDIVILVIPIDESAPKGRIILPQQNVLRECLDAHATAICCQVEELEQILNNITPKYVITDSQAFNKVKDIVPKNIILTSFSILMANYRGKLNSLVKSAETISKLQDGDNVLISEACTHHRQCNDIGTVKFPKWISDYTGKNINFEFTQGGEFPTDLTKYKLIIHCGGCMINEAEMKTRQQKAGANGIPMVNYGMAIAYMNGILERALEIFK